MKSSLKIAIVRMWTFYTTGPDAVVEQGVLFFRCLVSWALSCTVLYLLLGGAFLFDLWRLEYDPMLTLTAVRASIRECMEAWQLICLFRLSWLAPLGCLLFTLRRFSSDETTTADRTRVPFDPRR